MTLKPVKGAQLKYIKLYKIKSILSNFIFKYFYFQKLTYHIKLDDYEEKMHKRVGYFKEL